MDERIQKYEEKMKKTLASLESELVTIRAGRANPHILDKLAVDYYGAPTPLQQVANITVPEARMIQIQPWESSLIKGIEKAILTSDLGLNPSNDGKVIRLVFPELTEERRKELVKDVKKKGEAAKVAVRNIRRDANDAFKKLAKQDVSEDEIKELMNNETWITAKEAVEYGFATKTETEDERGVSQSVFGNIRETLLKPGIAPAQIAGAEKGRKIDTDEIAGKVVEKLMPLMQEKWQQKEKKSTSWGAFFD